MSVDTARTRRFWWASLDQRLMRVAVTAAASYVGKFGAGIAVLVTVPMARQALHPELFGLWMMLSGLLGFFAFADLGVGNGVLNRVTAAQARGDRRELQRVLVCGYGCTITVGMALLLLWWAWVSFSSEPTRLAGKVSAEYQQQTLSALTSFVVLLALNIPANLIQKILLGAQRGHWIGLSQLGSALATMVAVPLVLHTQPSVAALVWATLGMQMAMNLLCTFLWMRRNFSRQVLSLRQAFHKPTLVQLLRAGSLFFVLQLAVGFAFQSDAVVITQLLGQAAYGDFAVVQKLFLFISMLLNAALLGLWPAFGDAMTRNETAWARRLLCRALLVSGGVAAIAVTALVLSMSWVTHYWLRTAFTPSMPLLLALAAWTVVDAMGAVSGSFMNGANILRAQVVFALALGGVAFSAKWLIVPVYGTAGSVLATLLTYCLISVPGQFFIYKRLFTEKA